MAGAGLGLAIAKWDVTLNRGRIDLVPQPGKGSTFRTARRNGPSVRST